VPDWGWVHRELRRPNVTQALLWEEYRAGAPDGFGYSWFCDLYRGWTGQLKPTMRQTHLAGEKLFVDFAGRMGEATPPSESPTAEHASQSLDCELLDLFLIGTVVKPLVVLWAQAVVRPQRPAQRMLLQALNLFLGTDR
jgi:hypothetical protein